MTASRFTWLGLALADKGLSASRARTWHGAPMVPFLPEGLECAAAGTVQLGHVSVEGKGPGAPVVSLRRRVALGGALDALDAGEAPPLGARYLVQAILGDGSRARFALWGWTGDGDPARSSLPPSPFHYVGLAGMEPGCEVTLRHRNTSGAPLRYDSFASVVQCAPGDRADVVLTSVEVGNHLQPAGEHPIAADIFARPRRWDFDVLGRGEWMTFRLQNLGRGAARVDVVLGADVPAARTAREEGAP